MSKYPFTTPSTVRNNSHNKAKVYEVTGYKIETDNEGNPTSKGWEEAASIMERYGYSDYESSRYLFISKDGTINRHLSFSNGVPNSTRPYPSTQELNEIRNYAQKTDSKIIFFHNHPNGYAEPSEPDINLTEKLKSLLTDNSQKERLLGHIILDTGSGTYGFYDCNFSSWSMHYDRTLHSIKEYETDIKNRKLRINHNISSDPDREYFFLRIGDRKTNEQLGELVQFIQKEESFFTKESYIPVFFLKEYGVLEHLDYIHVSKFDDYTSLDEKLRSIGTLTGSTRCYMFPATYEQFALCTNYAERTFTEPKTNKVYYTGIVEGVFCTASESKKQLNKTYNRSIFDGFYNPFVKFREDSRDFPLGIEMDSYNKGPSIIYVTSEVLLDYSKKHSLWPLDESSANSYIDFLSSHDIKLSLDLKTNKLTASGKTEGTVFQNNEIDLFSIEAFVNQNVSNLQFQKVRNAKKNIQINHISDIYKESNMAEIHTKESGISFFNEEDYRISVAHEIKLNMPNLTDGERAAALAILEAGAGSMNMSLSEYVAQTFPNGIFGNINILKSQQQKGEEINGAVDIRGFGENVRALIYAGESADFSTFVHELAHVWQAQLTGQLKSDAEKAFQVENSDWRNSIYTFADGTQDTCGEAFAYGFEDFLKHKAGEMSSEDKKQIFEKFAYYMSRTYNGISENIEISDEIAEAYNAFVALDDNLLSQAEKAVQEEKNRTFENNSSLDNNMDSNNLQYQIVSESSIRKMASSMEKNRILQNLKAAVLLDEAKKLENLTPESKASRIRIETGWEKGFDGTWKYETDDSISFIKNGSGIQKLLDQDAGSLTKLSDGIPLKNLLEAPELFNIFPFMQDVKVRFYDEVDTYRGILSSDGIMINTHYLKDVNGEKGIKGILAHEIQHIIQAVEYTGKTQLENEDIEMLYMETLKAMKENGTKYYDYDVNSVNAGISDYIKSIGEIEARNVARRIAYSATERRHKTLQSTEDVSRNLQYQILRKINEKSENLQYQKRKTKTQENSMTTTNEQKQNYILSKLAAAGIEVVTNKEEFDRILESQIVLQKMSADLSEIEKLSKQLNEEKSKTEKLEKTVEQQKSDIQHQNYEDFIKYLDSVKDYIPEEINFSEKMNIMGVSYYHKLTNKIPISFDSSDVDNWIVKPDNNNKLYIVSSHYTGLRDIYNYEDVKEYFTDNSILTTFQESLTSFFAKNISLEKEKQKNFINDLDKHTEELKILEKKEARKNVKEWATKENYDLAFLNSSSKITELFGSERKAIGVLPLEINQIFPTITDYNLYAQKDYFIDHWVNHHSELTESIFDELQNVLDNYDDIYRDPDNGTVVFVKQEGRLNDFLVVEQEDDKLVFYDSTFLRKGIPSRFEKITPVREQELKNTVEVRHTSSTARQGLSDPAAGISTLNGNSNISQKTTKSSPQTMVQNGNTYGFAYEGKIYLNPEIWNSDVAVHEYTHLWDNYIQKTNLELWEKGKQIFQNTRFWEEVKADPNYANISDNDDLILSEVHSRICGKIADKVLNRILQEEGQLTHDTVIDWDKETWAYIANEIGFESFDKVDPDLKISTEELNMFLSMPMTDLMNGKNITQEIYFNNIPIQQLSGNNLSEHLVKTLSETARLDNEEFIDFFKRATSDYTIAQKKELNSIIPSLVKSEPEETPEQVLSRLESFIKNPEMSVSNEEPSVSNPSQASSVEPVQEEKDSQGISDELRYTYTPELEKENFEPVSHETPDHIVSEQELEKGPEKTNEKASVYSYKEFLVMASELKTPEEYEKFFQENFNFKEAAIKQIPPIADKKAQLFVDNKPSKLVIDYNQQEVSHLANWCLTNNMALFVPHPEDVKKQGIGLIAESLDKLNKLLGTDIKKEISGQQQGTELNSAEQKNQSQAVSGLPLLYEGSEWSEEELKLIKHVEMDKIPEFIADPYKADVAVPRFGMCLPDPTGEYKMQEQVGWHFAQKEIQNGCVSAIILTKINESGIRDFIKIDPTTYEAAINRNKELMEEWGKPRFKETHIKALYDYENALGVSKTETRSNTCAEYFHNFEAACRGAEGFDIAHNETEAMENAKQVYLKMSPHEKMRMHQMEKDWETVHGTSFHDELLRRFYEVRKDMEISQEQMRYAGHNFEDGIVSKQSLEDGKVLGELDNVSHKKIGDIIKISLKSKDYNGRVLDMPVTEMKIAGANKATNTVLLVDPQKNTSYQIPFDKFVGFCQKQELKHSKEQQKVEKFENKMQKVKQKKDIEDYGFDR